MIDARNVRKTFGTFAALNDVSLQIAEGEMVALLGPSGSGKTTLLRILGGLEFPDSGSVLFDGGDATKVAARDRCVGFVFQHYALFRHMTVFDNVSFGLRVRSRAERPSKQEIARRVHHLLSMVQLDDLATRYPSQLSGGQRQRVALARALAIQPRVLLLDEPFGALDAQVRKELRRWLRRLHDELKITGVFVTHDQEEALDVADRVVVMNQGRIEQIGSPTEIYDRPATPFVYQFLGNVNALPCQIRNGRAEIGSLVLPAPAYAGVSSAAGMAFVRPHDLQLSRPGEGEGALAVVHHVTVLGPTVRVELMMGEQIVEAETTRQRFSELGLASGQQVQLWPREARFFLRDGWEGTSFQSREELARSSAML
ncbi:MAG: sulfate/molybdate ABC transporter ATP-binding protein [Telmatospirillum sp.]|nr:sulfate/molybdate ABC transporter ATP-binding protein [Telmatospirillum sp.]MDR3438237.1 sulfate/molybdate ABC transporter ATP-binding protein [Telmatospirillum sp.]